MKLILKIKNERLDLKETINIKENRLILKLLENRRYREVIINTKDNKDLVGNAIVFEPSVILLLNPSLKIDKADRISMYDIVSMEILI